MIRDVTTTKGRRLMLPAAPSRWFTTRELAEELRYKGKHQLISVYRFIKRTGVKTNRRGPGGDLLVSRADLDRVLAARRGKVRG